MQALTLVINITSITENITVKLSASNISSDFGSLLVVYDITHKQASVTV